MAAKGEARAKISLDYSGWVSAAKAVKSIASDMLGFVKTTFAVAFGTILAGALLSFGNAAASAIPDVLRVGEELANMTRATGVASGEWAKFQLMMEKHVNFSDAGEILGRNAELLSKDAAIFRDVQIKIAEAGFRVQGFWIGFADKIAPVMGVFLDKFNALDLTKWGQQFAEPIANTIKGVYELFSSNQLGTLFGISLKIAVYGLWEAFSNLAVNFALLFFNLVSAVIDVLTKKLQSFVISILSFISNPSTTIGFALGDTMKEVAEMLQKVFLTGGIGFAASIKELKDFWASLQKDFKIKETDSTKFSNTNALQNFGVSNLQKLGLGGTVNGIQQSVEQQQLEVQRKQLTELEKISKNFNNNSTNIPLPAAIDPDTSITIA